MIPKKLAPDLIRGGCRFPACAKPCKRPSLPVDATAGEARSDKIMRNIKLAGSKNHDGRACARPSRSLRCYPLQGTRIKSTIWCDAGSCDHTQANLTLAIVTFGRTKRDRSGDEDSASPASLKRKRASARAVRVWG